MTIGQITKMAYIGTFPARRDVLMCESECVASLMNMDHNFFFIKSRKKLSHGTFWFVFQNLDPNVAYLEHDAGRRTDF